MRSKTLHILLLALLLVSFPLRALTQTAAVNQLPARQPRDWVRDGVIYEIYPRQFSAEGNFAGVTRQLDRLKELGVTILWLMPIHPIGQLKKKGTIVAPMQSGNTRELILTTVRRSI